MLARRLSFAPLLVGLLVGCVGADGADSTAGPLVYGADDRLERYQLTTAPSIALANSTAGVFRSTAVTLRTDGSYQVNASGTFATSYSLCAEEPFRTQPNPAFCTAFLVAPDVLATAGHCLRTATDCSTATFVFGYHMTDAATVRNVVPADDVYRCAAIISRQETTTNDWGLIRLNRAVVGHTPLTIRRSGAIAAGTSVAVAGHPAGLPLKYAAGATVRATSAGAYFESNLDTYGGNSGSPVIDAATGVVEGILVRGNTDFVYDSARRCYVSNRCADTGCPGWEDVTRTTQFASLIPGPLDCSANGTCNTACAAGADPDCVAVCGNGRCDVGESCDGRSGTTRCADCPGLTTGQTRRQYCYVNGVCTGRGCP
jgi:V8-like Glu-specific endopeptidase